MMRSLGFLILLILTLAAPVRADETTSGPAWRQSPEWVKDLVIYEIATKAFTSPKGPETGNFASLKSKLPYLQKTGITGIWLTGYSFSDPHHFLNIWSQYAVIEPDQLDPSLGTSEDFKALIEEAHAQGIKIFLDVITHGVMEQSSLLKQHPDWFIGEGWGGMREYDWQGGHIDLDDWWVRIWTGYVTRYGVDGFRLDLGTTRPDLWARIREGAFSAGHPIVIFEESLTALPGVTDFGQNNNWISDGAHSNNVVLEDIPRYYREKFGGSGDYRVAITFADGARAEGVTGAPGPFTVQLNGLGADKVSLRSGYYGTFGPDGVPDVDLLIRGIAAERVIKNVSVRREEMPPLGAAFSWGASVRQELDGRPSALPPTDEQEPLALSGPVTDLHIHIPTLTNGNAILLSCHDNGQVGFPTDKTNPYSAKGSRATIGYSFLFAPMIPIFMSGEEFDATFHALPDLSPEFYGGTNPGQGKWLYGSMLDWAELDEPRHRAMLDDVGRMLRLRREHPALLMPQLRGDIEPQLVGVPFHSNIEVPVPYMRWNGSSAVVVLGNRNVSVDARVTLDVPFEKLGTNNTKYRVSDLWRAGSAGTYTANELKRVVYWVKRDKTPGGGVGLLKIDAIGAR